MAARRVIAANEAGVQVATNNALLAVVRGVLRPPARGRNAGHRARGRRQRRGPGGHHRHLRPVRGRAWRPTTAASSPSSAAGSGPSGLAVGELEVASANLVRPLVLDPHVVVAPVEPAETVIRLVADDVPLDDLIGQGWLNRPELAQAQELVAGGRAAAQAGEAPPVRPVPGDDLLGRRLRGRPERVLRQLQHPGRRRREPVLGAAGPRPRRPRPSSAARRPSGRRPTSTWSGSRPRSPPTWSRPTRPASRRRPRWTTRGQSVAEAIESLQLNLTNIRRGAGLPGATRPIEVLQPIQALAQARADYLDAVLAYNRAQFRLYRALGQPPLPDAPLAAHASPAVPTADTGPLVPPVR